MEPLPLFKNNKERGYFFFALLSIFLVNIYLNYLNFKEFKDEEVFKIDATILNIYHKSNYDVIKLQTTNFICFSSTSKENNLYKLQNINLYLVTKDINFYEYLKGFYTKNFNIELLEDTNGIKQNIYNKIRLQHNNSQNSYLSSLYSALFLAIPLNTELRDICASYGLSHLIAISGFHLGVISLVLYFIVNIIYKPIHQRYLSFRNKRYDIVLITIVAMFSYLIFVDLVPSLLRAFCMFIFGIFLLRNNIKLLSFETLFIIVCLIIALFPKLLFSLSLWFSVSGVFYIFLFIKYFKNLNKYLQFILFNFWIYGAINPVTHYFFGTTAIEQLYSPIVTVLFTIFYPLAAFLHLINSGGLFDNILLQLLQQDIKVIDKFTPLWFFITYISVSFYSIFNKKGFILLNTLFILFNFWLFLALF
ncbi:MAG: ComEC/Rec2 family competence protein [Campylobacterota bacterium]|nr:ComEC/Rec2 family competence protein [Campylobacterota bacterium]